MQFCLGGWAMGAVQRVPTPHAFALTSKAGLSFQEAKRQGKTLLWRMHAS